MVTRRVWAQNVVVDVEVLTGRLDALRSRREAAPDPVRDATAEAVDGAVRGLLDRARRAALREDPRPLPVLNWWRGTSIEAAHQTVHAAKAEIVALYDEAALRAEVPDAVARLESALHRDDPRLAEGRRLLAQAAAPPDPVAVRKALEVGYAASDQTHSRVRSFRNVIIVAGLLLAAFLGGFVWYVAQHPEVVPLCFHPETPTASVCPTSAGTGGPGGKDVVAVTLLGLMGGALASAVSVRNVRGTSTPYDVPVVLALLKIPAGGLTAIAALIAVRGDFVPGLTSLDSQEQILAYALAFGYAQQVLTRLVDRQGQELLSSVPSKDVQSDRPSTVMVDRPVGAPPPVVDDDAAEVPEVTSRVRRR